MILRYFILFVISSYYAPSAHCFYLYDDDYYGVLDFKNLQPNYFTWGRAGVGGDDSGGTSSNAVSIGGKRPVNSNAVNVGGEAGVSSNAIDVGGDLDGEEEGSPSAGPDPSDSYSSKPNKPRPRPKPNSSRPRPRPRPPPKKPKPNSPSRPRPRPPSKRPKPSGSSRPRPPRPRPPANSYNNHYHPDGEPCDSGESLYNNGGQESGEDGDGGGMLGGLGDLLGNTAIATAIAQDKWLRQNMNHLSQEESNLQGFYSRQANALGNANAINGGGGGGGGGGISNALNNVNAISLGGGPANALGNANGISAYRWYGRGQSNAIDGGGYKWFQPKLNNIQSNPLASSAFRWRPLSLLSLPRRRSRRNLKRKYSKWKKFV